MLSKHTLGRRKMLKLENVNTHYGQIQALHDISLEVKQGEIVTLIGANGTGKTTLMMTICGDPRASSGKIFFDDEEISSVNTPEIMRKGLAVVPEGRRVFSRLTVQENLHMGAYFRSKAEYEETLEQVLALFPRLQERIDQRAGTMSGGEQQMLAIGRAMMSRPRMILLDEPSLGLAPIIIQQIFDIIEKLRDDGVTIFLVEQNANQALRIADRGYVMENGRVTLSDTGAALLVNEDVRKAYLGG